MIHCICIWYLGAFQGQYHMLFWQCIASFLVWFSLPPSYILLFFHSSVLTGMSCGLCLGCHDDAFAAEEITALIFPYL